jgi:hypothetical protein
MPPETEGKTPDPNLQESHRARDMLVSLAVPATAFSVTERTAGKKLCGALRKLAANDGSPVVSQIMALERELASLDAEIARQERAMNVLVYWLYGLGAEEIELVEKG